MLEKNIYCTTRDDWVGICCWNRAVTMEYLLLHPELTSLLSHRKNLDVHRCFLEEYCLCKYCLCNCVTWLWTEKAKWNKTLSLQAERFKRVPETLSCFLSFLELTDEIKWLLLLCWLWLNKAETCQEKSECPSLLVILHLTIISQQEKCSISMATWVEIGREGMTLF